MNISFEIRRITQVLRKSDGPDRIGFEVLQWACVAQSDLTQSRHVDDNLRLHLSNQLGQSIKVSGDVDLAKAKLTFGASSIWKKNIVVLWRSADTNDRISAFKECINNVAACKAVTAND
jgi:hypothetical protein